MSRKTVSELLTGLTPLWVGQAAQFRRYKLPYLPPATFAQMPDAETRLELIGSVTEEFEEFVRSVTEGDIDKTADAIVDTIYTLLIAGLQCGLPLGALFAEVHETNMAKLPAGPGTRGRKTPDGTSMKPAGWVAPRITEILDAHNASREEPAAYAAQALKFAEAAEQLRLTNTEDVGSHASYEAFVKGIQEHLTTAHRLVEVPLPVSLNTGY